MKGWAAWFTGLPGSGKSTLARRVAKKLQKEGIQVQVLNLDKLRKILTPKPTYSEKERRMVYEILVCIAKNLTENGLNVLIDATGNRRAYRERARKEIENFMEIYVKCPLSICIQRERERGRTFGAPRKIYETKDGNVPGLDAPYEEPLNPDVVVETDKSAICDSVEKIVSVLKNKFIQ